MKRIKNILDYLFDSHKFFIKQSPKFVGVAAQRIYYKRYDLTMTKYKYTFKQKVYFPIAYFKFMRASYEDALKKYPK